MKKVKFKNFNRKKNIPFVLCSLFFFIISCATFITDDQSNAIKNLEKNIYVLKEDAGEGNKLIKKAENIKLYVSTGKNFIKIYCYPANTDLLKAEKTLIVYMFDEDFENKKFNFSILQEELNKKVEKK